MPLSLASSAWSSFLIGYRRFLRSIHNHTSVSVVQKTKETIGSQRRIRPVSISKTPLTPKLLGKIQIEMRSTCVLLHFDSVVSISTLLEELPKSVETLCTQIRPQARSLFCVRLCFGSRFLHPSFLRLVRTYVQQETGLLVRGLSCSKESIQNILSASIGMEVEEVQNKSLIVHQTFRSGMEYSVEGELLVYGDVHEGAHIQATGSITIMGVLAGTAHAGVNGNTKAQIFASSMEEPLLWIDSHHVGTDEIIHKRGYSVASLSKKLQINKYTMGDV